MTRTPSEIALNTALACRSAAAIWRDDGSAPHRAFADELDTWADRAQALALAAERGGQLDLFGIPSHRLTPIQKKKEQ